MSLFFYINGMKRILLLSAILSVGLICKASLPGLVDSLNYVIGDRNVGVALITSNADTIEVGNKGTFELASVFKFHQAAALSRVVDFDLLVKQKYG